MSVQQDLREAKFKHNATLEEYWKYADAMEEKGDADFKWTFCENCGYSLYDNSTSPPRIICKRFNGLVSRYDTCKYATMDQKLTNMFASINNSSSTNRGGSTSGSGRSGSTSGGCYIATAVYGSYDCPEVWTLRRFRDITLKGHFFGRLFIKAYYAISPNLVKRFGKTKAFNLFWKKWLDRMVARLQERGVSSAPYEDR